MILRRSLAFRLFAGAAAWALVLLLAGAVALTALYQRSILQSVDSRLTSVVGALVAAAETGPEGDLVLARRPSDPDYSRVFSGRYWELVRLPDLAEQEPEVLLISRSLWDEQLALPAQLLEDARAAPGQILSVDVKGPEGAPLRVVGQAVQLPSQTGLILAMAAEDRAPADREVRNFGITSGLMFLLFAALIAAGVFVQVRIGLEPVLRMRASVADVREGNAERVEGEFPEELGPLAEELNATLDHSRELVERSRTHVGNLAHALKTPLAVLTNEARTAQGDMARLVEKQTGIMASQVDHHLRRARAAAHAKAIGARTEAAMVVSDLTRTLQKIYQRRGVEITAELEPGLIFRGERQDLEEMIGNLMDNACKWATARVRVSARRSGDRMLNICIEDDGPGLSEEQQKSALQRGVRLDEQAPGTGLGLSIVADLAKAYDGEIELGRSELGGLLAVVSLPTTPR
ncbi:MAG: sensor histidine kinase [Alphaproteobacteria bacterium]|nr:sensor histidine kinase [Alphaproteobacteria bacterium]